MELTENCPKEGQEVVVGYSCGNVVVCGMIVASVFRMEQTENCLKEGQEVALGYICGNVVTCGMLVASVFRMIRRYHVHVRFVQ